MGDNVEFDTEIDVLVIGAGGCGLVAALAAAERGATVAVVEKAPRLQGNTALSSGSVPGAGSRFQRAAGIADSPARYAADLRRVAGPHDADALVDRLAGISAELVEWLVDSAGVAMTLVETYRHVGHSVPRLHAPPARRGADLVADLERALAARDIPLALGQEARALITRDGAVRGALTVDAEGREARIGAGAVILASNGFAAARDLVAAHCPQAARARYAGAPGSTGEALRWGTALGAATGNLGAYQAHAGLAEPSGALVTWTVVERGGFIVDGNGARFADETLGYSAFAAPALAAAPPLHMIYDARIADDVAAGQPEFAELAAAGGALAADDAAALAARIGVPAETFAATCRAAADAAEGGATDTFGRRQWGLGALRPALRATRIAPALFHTQGGLMVDGDARVLARDGTWIRGLYAGGGAAVGISGLSGGTGYVSGNGLLAALGLGYLAGRAAGRQAGAEAGDAPATELQTQS